MAAASTPGGRRGWFRRTVWGAWSLGSGSKRYYAPMVSGPPAPLPFESGCKALLHAGDRRWKETESKRGSSATQGRSGTGRSSVARSLLPSVSQHSSRSGNAACDYGTPYTNYGMNVRL